LRRVSAVVPLERAEAARALMLELFPHGFEERDAPDGLELTAYTDSAGEERLWAAFGRGASQDVPSGWEDRWRQFHRPARVGPLWVGPPWERPDRELAVTIDPGRAFGTGGHPTTLLCLELLLELEPTSVLDVGCGSGILAVAAAKLGFAPVVALDHDPAAIDAARRNAEANGVALELRLADALSSELPAAAVTLANLTGELVRKLAPRVTSDVVVASGYLEFDQPEFDGFVRATRRHAEGWAADLFRREE
jgi:ribosomal protein L11 methyltransferase